MRLRLVRVPAVLARLGDRLAPLRRRRQREVLGVEVADDALQPDVEERREIRIVDAAVVRRIGDHGVERLVVVEELLGAAARDDRWIRGSGQFANAVRFPVQREGKAAFGACQAIDLGKVVDHFQRLAITDCSLRSLNGRLPPRELVERDDQTAERHREIRRQRPRAIFPHAFTDHLGMSTPDLLDEGKEHEQLSGCEQFSVAFKTVSGKLVTEFPLQGFTGTHATKLSFKRFQSLFYLFSGQSGSSIRPQVYLASLFRLATLRRQRADDGRERLLHPAGRRHFLDVLGGSRRVARDAHRLSRAGLLRLPRDIARGTPGHDVPAQAVAALDARNRRHGSAFLRSLAQPRLTHQRHRGGAAGPSARHGTRPDVRDRFGLPGESLIPGAEELRLTGHVLSPRYLDGRVQIADLPPHPVENPCAPPLEIIRETRAERLRIHQRAQLDQVRDRVVVDGVALATEPGRFERDCAATREQIQHLGRFPAVQHSDPLACLADGRGVRFVGGQRGDEGRRFLAFLIGGRCRNERRVDGGARCRDRAAGRPVMDQLHVPPRMELLPGRDGVERIQRQVVLDQPAIVRRHRHPICRTALPGSRITAAAKSRAKLPMRRALAPLLSECVRSPSATAKDLPELPASHCGTRGRTAGVAPSSSLPAVS